jgi:hypothetical protein
VDARSYAEVSGHLTVFHPHHGRPAAHPLLLAVREFGRQNQNHFQLAAFTDGRVGIKENPARVQIAGNAGGLLRSSLSREGDRYAHWKALPGAAFPLGVRHREVERITTAGWRGLILTWPGADRVFDQPFAVPTRLHAAWERAGDITSACFIAGASFAQMFTSSSLPLSPSPLFEYAQASSSQGVGILGVPLPNGHCVLGVLLAH